MLIKNLMFNECNETQVLSFLFLNECYFNYFNRQKSNQMSEAKLYLYFNFYNHFRCY